MKVRIEYDLNCGETSCYKERGDPCQFLSSRRFGTELCCSLFMENDNKHGIRPKTIEACETGWVQRLPECVSAAVGNETK